MGPLGVGNMEPMEGMGGQGGNGGPRERGRRGEEEGEWERARVEGGPGERGGRGSGVGKGRIQERGEPREGEAPRRAQGGWRKRDEDSGVRTGRPIIQVRIYYSVARALWWLSLRR